MIILYSINLAISIFNCLNGFYQKNLSAGFGWLSASIWIIDLIIQKL